MLVTIGAKGLTLQVICYAQINSDQTPHLTPPHPTHANLKFSTSGKTFESNASHFMALN